MGEGRAHGDDWPWRVRQVLYMRAPFATGASQRVRSRRPGPARAIHQPACIRPTGPAPSSSQGSTRSRGEGHLRQSDDTHDGVTFASGHSSVFAPSSNWRK